MLSAIIIEDNPQFAEELNQLISQHDNIKVKGIGHSVESGIDLIASTAPDLLFLDVELPDGTSFDILKEVNQQSFQVIFITGHNDYAIQAFRHSAIDYLTKPIDKQDLHAAIERAILNRKCEKNYKKLEFMFENLQMNKFTKLVLPSMDSFEFLDKEDIVYCESDGNITIIHLKSGQKVATTYSLKKVDEILIEKIFYRVHKSFLVNLNYVKRVLKTDGGIVVMQNDIQLPIARRRKADFADLIGLN